MTDGVRFCAACGAPVAADAVSAMDTRLRRQQQALRLLVVVAGLVLAVAVGVLLSSVRSSRQAPEGSPVSGVTAAAPQEQVPAAAAPAAQNSPDQPTSPAASSSPPQTPPQASSTSNPAINAPAGGIDMANVQKALAQMTHHGGTGNLPAPSAAPSGSDRYPGSQPLNVENANLPDIGVPVSREVYTTADPVPAVIRYYQQRYPDATLTEIDGQQILAVEGASKVIAIGSTGQETRIAIVQAGR